MHEEMVDLETFAAAVLAARPDAFSVEEALDASIGAGANATSLHLDDVVERYRLASEAFSRAMEAAVVAGDDALEAQGAAVLERRREHETVAMAGWSPVGR